MDGWRVEVEIRDAGGTLVGHSNTCFETHAAMESWGVHLLHLTEHVELLEATWDGQSPGSKVPIVYSYVEDLEYPVPIDQHKLYWLLSSGSNADPRLVLKFRAKKRGLLTHMATSLSHVVANGSSAVHQDPTLVIESRFLFTEITPTSDLKHIPKLS
jgi:hypothetical protein